MIRPRDGSDRVLPEDELVPEDSHSVIATTPELEPSSNGTPLGDFREARLELDLAEDRERIAQDLHDSVIQRLFASAMRLASLRTLVSPDLHDDIDRLVRELDCSIAEIRRAIAGLSPDEAVDSGVQADVLAVLEQERPALGFAPTFHGAGDLWGADAEWRWQVAAILREVLSNVARHAEATEAHVELVVDDTVALRVSDDGVGYDPRRHEIGRGVKNVVRRAESLGGTLHIGPASGGGTLVECRLPRPGSSYRSKLSSTR